LSPDLVVEIVVKLGARDTTLRGTARPGSRLRRIHGEACVSIGYVCRAKRILLQHTPGSD
jgi:hypothetical protein